VLAGRRLVGDTGLNCITCHVIGDLPPVGTPGPDLERATLRNRYEWWRRYVQNPPRFKVGTRMPTFFATGRGTVVDVYGGDPVRQSEAIWAYLSLGDRMPVPPGAVAGESAVRVEDRPVVLRAFLGDAGSRAIAVGFPAGLHFAFDAQSCRLVSGWRGDFVDARGSWSGRAGETLAGRGGTVWTAPDGPAIVVGASVDPRVEQVARFAGYRLDATGVPTFRYVIGRATIEERVEPEDSGRRFRRTLAVTGLDVGEPVWFASGPAMEDVRAVEAAGRREAISGSGPWLGFAPDADSVKFEARYRP
jgi:hypothetical protein